MTLGRILVAKRDDTYLMKFVGDVRLTISATIDACIEGMFQDEDFEAVLIDLSAVEGVDSTTLGLLARLALRCEDEGKVAPLVVSTNPDITRVIETMGLDDVFRLIDRPLEEIDQLEEAENCPSSTEETRMRVLEAHRTLMSINEGNRETFAHLVANLEASG